VPVLAPPPDKRGFRPPSTLREGDPRKAVFDRQCPAPGSTFAFDVKGGEREAFALLDNLQIMKLVYCL
jgi:methionine-gamma-lyase